MPEENKIQNIANKLLETARAARAQVKAGGSALVNSLPLASYRSDEEHRDKTADGDAAQSQKARVADAAFALLKLPAGAILAQKLVRILTGAAPRANAKSSAQLAALGMFAHIAPKFFRVSVRASAPLFNQGAEQVLLNVIPPPNNTQALEASVWLHVITDMYGTSAPPTVTAWALLGFFVAPLSARALILFHNLTPQTADAETTKLATQASAWIFLIFIMTAAAILSFVLPSQSRPVHSAVFQVLATLLLRMLAFFPESLSEEEVKAPTFAFLQKRIVDTYLLPAMGSTVAAAFAAQAIGSALPGRGGHAARAALFVSLDSAFGEALNTHYEGDAPDVRARLIAAERTLSTTLQETLASAAGSAKEAAVRLAADVPLA